MPALPGPLRLVGKKHAELLKIWMPSLAVFGGISFSAMVYVTEWRVISDYIPYYNGKFKDQE